MQYALSSLSQATLFGSSTPLVLSEYPPVDSVVTFIGDAVALHIRCVPERIRVHFFVKEFESRGTVVAARELPPREGSHFGAVVVDILHQDCVSFLFGSICWVTFCLFAVSVLL